MKKSKCKVASTNTCARNSSSPLYERNASGWSVVILLLMLAAARLPSKAQSAGSEVLTFDPQSARRGDTIFVSVAGTLRDPSSAQIIIDGSYPLCTSVKSANSFQATIPADPAGPVSHDPVPCQDATPALQKTSDAKSATTGYPFLALGKHRIGLKADGRYFESTKELSINRAQPLIPQLQWITPNTVVSGRSSKVLQIYGDNFITSPAEDNQIRLGGNLLHVLWDGCPANADSGLKAQAHGQVVSAQEIDLCDLTYLDRQKLDLTVQQGDRVSGALSINVQSYSTATIVWISFAILLAVIFVLVIFAYTAGKYVIGKREYRIFSVLFLDPETSTFSLSKYQFYAWSGSAIFAYSYYALSQVLVQMGRLPDIPGNLPGIIAIGAGTTIGSQVLTSIRGPKGAGPITPSLSDFVTSGGVAAPDRIQIFVWTTLGAIAFSLATLRVSPLTIKDLPDMGQGWLYMMGLSSVGYLGGKLARLPGPVLTEMSISAGSPSSSGGIGPATSAATTGNSAASNTSAPQSRADLGQPIAAAKQALGSVQAAIGAGLASKAPNAFNAAQLAANALSDAISQANDQPSGLLDSISSKVMSSDAAAQSAAAEFGTLTNAGSDAAAIEAARILAEQAQAAASAVQDLSDGIQQAISSSAQSTSVLSSDPPPPGVTNIELRGRNLSTTATFEVNGAPLPFRMLAPEDNVRAPQKVAADDSAGMATELRLTIAPALMVDSDLKTFQSWFGTPGNAIKLAIINPDGQRAEISADLPPGVSQSRS